MAISPINFSFSAAAAITPSHTPLASPATNRQVAAAVQTLNDAGSAGPGRAFSIAIDSKTKVPVVRIVDSTTNQLIEQIPSQYILDLAQQIDLETSSNSGANGR